MKILNDCVIVFLTLTRPLLHAILGTATCKYPIPCTEFAISELKKKPFIKALFSIFKRILCCLPFIPYSE